MKRSKMLFLFMTALFFLLLGYASYDISTKTTFPGSKPQLKERLEKKLIKEDTIEIDSINASKK